MAASERTRIRVRKVRSDKGVKRGPRKGTAEGAVRMGPVVRLRLEHGYGRALPPGHRAMLQGGEEKPVTGQESIGAATAAAMRAAGCRWGGGIV